MFHARLVALLVLPLLLAVAPATRPVTPNDAGLNFRSSQESTKGIGDKTEYFADTHIDGAEVLRARVYFGRLNAVPVSRSSDKNVTAKSGDHG